MREKAVLRKAVQEAIKNVCDALRAEVDDGVKVAMELVRRSIPSKDAIRAGVRHVLSKALQGRER